ncbi:MAG TPA: 8-amino-7-oxononanoate synthase [Planctomycetaceae bacterium]|nr:8-amino-7-oxononanoate synthase [Planctomycetaceae bacterium]
MNMSWQDHLQRQLERLQVLDLRRRRGGLLPRIQAKNDSRTHDTTATRLIDGPLDFGNNDYLGLRQHPHIYTAVQETLQRCGWGSGASPVLCGHHTLHSRLEQALAELNQVEDSLVFSSGFACNLGVLSCLLDQDSIVFSDQLNHASLIDGIRLGRSDRVIYNHCDLDHLKSQLKSRRAQYQRSLIVTESIFSMDGDQAPLLQLAELAGQYDSALIVDEAHALGLFGTRGAGLLEEMQLSDQVLLKLGTLSKSLGGVGGYVAGCSVTMEYLVNRCRSYLFSTAPPAAAMAAALAAVELLPSLCAIRTQLLEQARALRTRLSDMGWTVPSGRSPIIPLVIGEASDAIALSRRLGQQGIYVPAIRPPTVPNGTSRLRISLSATHTTQDFDRLCSVLGPAATKAV